MTIFEDLQRQAHRWAEERDAYDRRSAQFLVDFANEFREHIGAPPGAFYVQPVRARVDENGIYSFPITPTLDELLFRDEEGYWTAGIQLTIDTHKRSFSHLYFWYLV
jgi:hypothetical protein